MTQETRNIVYSILLLVTPIVIGGLVAVINSKGLNGTIEKIETWVRRWQQGTAQKRGRFSKYIINPILWTIIKFCDWTNDIAHRGLKNGLRVTTTLYAVAVWLLILYVASIVVVVIIGMIVVLWVLGLILKFKDIIDGTEPGRDSSNNTRRGMHDGYSEEKETLVGKEYTQYYDKNGNTIATEEVKERLFGGKYVQCYDKDGNEIGTKELKEKFFGGKYVQQNDEDGNEVGTSETKEKFFGGKYTEHYDTNGNTIGTSEKKEGFFGGKFTEHKPD